MQPFTHLQPNPDAETTEAWRASLIGPAIDFFKEHGVSDDDALRLLNVFHSTDGGRPPCPLQMGGLWIANIDRTASALGMRPEERLTGYLEKPASPTSPAWKIELRPEGPQHRFLIARQVPGNDRGPAARPYFYSHHVLVPETHSPMLLAFALDARFDGTTRWFEPSQALYFPRSRGTDYLAENRLANLEYPQSFLQVCVQVARAAGFPLEEWEIDPRSAGQAARRDAASRATTDLGRAPSRQYAGAGTGSQRGVSIPGDPYGD